MEMVINVETQTLSGKAYAVVVPKDLMHSFKQGIFIEDILPECTVYNLPMSAPKDAAALLVRLARKYDNALLVDVPATVQAYLKECRESKSDRPTPMLKILPAQIPSESSRSPLASALHPGSLVKLR